MTTICARLLWLCALVALLALEAGSASATGEVPKGPSELLFVAQIVILMLTGRLLGEVMLWFKQPAVMGQLIAGLVLGPSVLGALFPDWQHALFPAAKEQKAMIDAISQFGVLLLLLLTGMEIDLKLGEANRTGVGSRLARGHFNSIRLWRGAWRTAARFHAARSGQAADHRTVPWCRAVDRIGEAYRCRYAEGLA